MSNMVSDLINLVQKRKSEITNITDINTKEIITSKTEIKNSISYSSNFSKKRYKFTLIETIIFKENEWFNNKNNVSIGEFINIKEDGNHYISYLENNIAFTNPPEKTNIKIDEEYDYKFLLNGIGEGVNLFIITYSKGIKQSVYSTIMNNELILKFPKEVDAIRLALRCTVKGTVEISNINIYKKKIIGKLQINEYRELGIDIPQNLKDLKLAAICDEFTYECLKDEVNLITFTPDEWRAKLEITNPHILFIESAWSGKNHLWSRKIASATGAGLEYITEIIQWCKSRKIPTVFWNKEDPVHYNAFINTAKMCDYIYTTDRNMIPEYLSQVSHNNVDVMQFFAQVKIQNPTKIIELKREEACFAGTYYATKYLERQADMLDLLDITKSTGLTIFDRHYDDDDPQYKFPEYYEKFIIGKLKPWEIIKAYKGYKYTVNVNSVINSPTMFSRRVFESLACGTPVISTYSKAIDNTFKDIVVIGKTKEELEEKFNNIQTDKLEYDKISLLGIREVFTKHTITDRLLKLCTDINMDIHNNVCEVALITTISNEQDVRLFEKIIKKQTYKNIRGIVINNGIVNAKQSDCVHYVNTKEELVNICNEIDYINIIDLSNFYGKNYVLDYVIAFKYCNASIVGKKEYFTINKNELQIINENSEYEYSNSVQKDTIFIKTNIFNKYEINEVILDILNGNIIKLSRFGEKVYSINKYNFIENYDKYFDAELEVIEI